MSKESKLERRKGERKKARTFSDTVVAVFPDGKAGKKALEALECAIDNGSSSIERIPFEQLDFGDLKALEKFYSAPVVVVDVTERRYEACLYYQIGLRESFGMKHNVVMSVDQESSYIAAGTFIPDQISSAGNLGVSILQGVDVVGGPKGCEQEVQPTCPDAVKEQFGVGYIFRGPQNYQPRGL